MFHIPYPMPFGYPPVELIEAEREADGFIRAPFFSRTLTLFIPKTAAQRATFEKVVRAYNRHKWTATIGSARAYDYACLTHNALISGQQYSVEYGDVGSDNDRQPTGLPYRNPWDAPPLLLLTVENIGGPVVTELLPQQGVRLGDIHRSVQMLDACRAKANHSGDILTLSLGEEKLFEAWRLLLRTTAPGRVL